MRKVAARQDVIRACEFDRNSSAAGSKFTVS